jgi:hypothetical protein
VNIPAHVTKGDGDLEKDLLPHFLVRLPCDATGLRYGEWEDIGPNGWLALRFQTSPPCLDAFLRDNGLQPVQDNPISAQTTCTNDPANSLKLRSHRHLRERSGQHRSTRSVASASQPDPCIGMVRSGG